MGLLLLLCLTSLGLACSGSQKKKDQGLTQNGLRIPEHFKNIPADSPYVMTSLKVLPYDQLAWDLDKQYTQSMQWLRKVSEDTFKNYGDYENMPTSARTMMAVVEELSAYKSVKELSAIGLTPYGHFSFYGIGAFPAVRVELEDGKKFEQFVQRIEARVGASMPSRDIQGFKVRYADENQMIFPLIVTDNELLLGMSSASFSEEYISYLTGTKKPEKSLYDDNRLLTMQEKYNMLPYISGYFDVQAMAAPFLDTASTSLTARSIRSIDGAEMPQLSEVCRAEYASITKTFPRAIFGYTEVSRASLKARAGLEMTNDVPSNLKAIKTSAPAYDSDLRKNALFAMTMGINVDTAIEVLRKEAQRIGSDPYQCEDLQWINESAEEFFFNAQMIPVTFRSILGTSFILKDLDFSVRDRRINNIEVMAVSYNPDPDTFFRALKLFVPELLGNLEIKPNLQPVTVPLPMEVSSQLQGMPAPMMVMSSQALGLSIGSAMQSEATSYTKTVSQDDAPLFSLTYDMNRIMDIFRGIMQETGASSTEDITNMNAMLGMYDMLGPATVAFDVQDEGFFFSVDTVMKPKE